MDNLRELDAFLARHDDIVRVEVVRARGSAPRDAGTEMLVARDSILGTI
ncbi:MAG TPA: XdhC family protein, partial [Paracoccaceae bacterium]|nr:XdhC family protein [Paracoccaceae bacterium]